MDHTTNRAKHSAQSDDALRNFLRGYFHEDLADEYGTPAQAVARFCSDADRAHALKVRNEWQQACETHSSDLANLNARLNTLGSSWKFMDQAEVESVSEAFTKALTPS